jgi:hypothetical protein
MLAVFARVEPALRKSITFDNDTAFAQHRVPCAKQCRSTTLIGWHSWHDIQNVVRKKLAWASIVRDALGILQLPRPQEDEAKNKCAKQVSDRCRAT